jgi:hypothetical protein
MRSLRKNGRRSVLTMKLMTGKEAVLDNMSLGPTPEPESWFADRPSARFRFVKMMRRGGSTPCVDAYWVLYSRMVSTLIGLRLSEGKSRGDVRRPTLHAQYRRIHQRLASSIPWQPVDCGYASGGTGTTRALIARHARFAKRIERQGMDFLQD